MAANGTLWRLNNGLPALCRTSPALAATCRTVYLPCPVSRPGRGGTGAGRHTWRSSEGIPQGHLFTHCTEDKPGKHGKGNLA